MTPIDNIQKILGIIPREMFVRYKTQALYDVVSDVYEQVKLLVDPLAEFIRLYNAGELNGHDYIITPEDYDNITAKVRDRFPVVTETEDGLMTSADKISLEKKSGKFVGKLGYYSTYTDAFIANVCTPGAFGNFTGIPYQAAEPGQIFVIEYLASDTKNYYIVFLECVEHQNEKLRGKVVWFHKIENDKIQDIESYKEDVTKVPTSKAVADYVSQNVETLVGSAVQEALRNRIPDTAIFTNGALVEEIQSAGDYGLYIKFNVRVREMCPMPTRIRTNIHPEGTEDYTLQWDDYLPTILFGHEYAIQPFEWIALQ